MWALSRVAPHEEPEGKACARDRCEDRCCDMGVVRELSKGFLRRERLLWSFAAFDRALAVGSLARTRSAAHGAQWAQTLALPRAAAEVVGDVLMQRAEANIGGGHEPPLTQHRQPRPPLDPAHCPKRCCLMQGRQGLSCRSVMGR